MLTRERSPTEVEWTSAAREPAVRRSLMSYASYAVLNWAGFLLSRSPLPIGSTHQPTGSSATSPERADEGRLAREPVTVVQFRPRIERTEEGYMNTSYLRLPPRTGRLEAS